MLIFTFYSGLISVTWGGLWCLYDLGILHDLLVLLVSFLREEKGEGEFEGRRKEGVEERKPSES